jgi:ferrous iron transport protein B
MSTVQYSPEVEQYIQRIEAYLDQGYSLSTRSMSLLLLSGDEQILSMVSEQAPRSATEIQRVISEAQRRLGDRLLLRMAQAQQRRAVELTRGVLRRSGSQSRSWSERLSRATLAPLTGIPILILVLVLLYLLVGVLGAQVLVDWLEVDVFGQWINPWINQITREVIPWPIARSLVAGEFGILTLGVRYAVAIILPIVGTFFLAFSVIEDSGYLPRLALLIDRLFKKIGLNGRAVIPMVLGFGCDTMATVVTRTLETTREKLISTMLLALAIPCSAQLGVIFAILAGRPAALAIWAGTVFAIFLLVGFLAARIMPGEQPYFYMELPPLRVPRLSNVVVKTYTRMEWYFREVLPLFILASILIWAGQVTGVFQAVIAVLEPLVRLLGLPEETAVAFLFGFFRRDYGAAGLYDIQGLMTGVQLTVAAVTLTLFVPCIAQFSVMLKERGWKTALAAVGFIFPFAFFSGWALHAVLSLLGVVLL